MNTKEIPFAWKHYDIFSILSLNVECYHMIYIKDFDNVQYKLQVRFVAQHTTGETWRTDAVFLFSTAQMVRPQVSKNGVQHAKQHQASDHAVRRVLNADECIAQERSKVQRREQTFHFTIWQGKYSGNQKHTTVPVIL